MMDLLKQCIIKTQQSYNLSVSPTPRLRIRNDFGGDGIISAAQFYSKRGSGAASVFNIGVITMLVKIMKVIL